MTDGELCCAVAERCSIKPTFGFAAVEKWTKIQDSKDRILDLSEMIVRIEGGHSHRLQIFSHWLLGPLRQ